jgi:hypothetical protein
MPEPTRRELDTLNAQLEALQKVRTAGAGEAARRTVASNVVNYEREVAALDRLYRATVLNNGAINSQEAAVHKSRVEVEKNVSALEAWHKSLNAGHSHLVSATQAVKEWAAAFGVVKAAGYIEGLVHEQANWIISLERTAGQLAATDTAYKRNITQLQQVQATLRLTRQEMVEFSGSVRESILHGIGTEEFAGLTRQLQNLRGHAAGLETAKQAARLSSVDVRAARQGGDDAYLRALQRQQSDEARVTLQELRSARNLSETRFQGGRAQALTEAEAGQKATKDAILAAFGDAGMGPATAALRNYLPLISGASVGSLLALRDIHSYMVASGMAGGGFSGGGFLGGGAGGKAGMLQRVGVGLGLAALGTASGYAAQHFQDQAATQGVGSTAGAAYSAAAKLGRIGQGTGYGAALGSVIPGLGTVVGGLLGALTGVINEATGMITGRRLDERIFGTKSGGGGGRETVTSSPLALALSTTEASRRQIEQAQAGALQGLSASQARGRFAEVALPSALAMGVDHAVLTRMVRDRQEALDTEQEMVFEATREAKAQANKRLQDLKSEYEPRIRAEREGSDRQAVIQREYATRRAIVEQQMYDASTKELEYFAKRLETFGKNLQSIAEEVVSGPAFKRAGYKGQILDTYLGRLQTQGMSPAQAREFYGRRAALSGEQAALAERGLPGQLMANAKLYAQATAVPLGAKEGDFQFKTEEERSAYLDKLRESNSRLILGLEEKRTKAIQDQIAAITQAAEAERRRISVVKSQQEVALDVATFVGASYQQVYALQRQIVESKAQELAVTQRELTEMAGKGNLNAQDQERMQQLQIQAARQSADVFKETIGVQKSFLDKAIGQAFGVHGRGGSAFQPAITERALFGEYSLFGGMMMRGQVSPEAQRAGMRGSALAGLLGGKAGSGAGAGLPGLPEVTGPTKAVLEITLNSELLRGEITRVTGDTISLMVRAGKLLTGERGRP